MEWSDVKEQVFAFRSDIVVSAGAGSGKTAALVELYLRLLAGETSLGRALEVDEIVAITFTDKAATEMRERVRRGVLERLASGGDKTLWERHRRALPGAGIATFHAFCSRILRENPAEAEVDPSFALLDELAAGAELANALDGVIEAELVARSADIRLLLQNFPLAGRGHGKGLREHLIDLHRQQAGSAGRQPEPGTHPDGWLAEAGRRFARERARLAELLPDVVRLLQGKELKFHDALRPLPELYAKTPLSPADSGVLAAVAAMQGCIAGGWGKEKWLKDALTDSLEAMELCAQEALSAPLKGALARLSGKVAAAYGKRKEERGVVDFDDLQRKARDLLERDAEVRALYRERFAVVMVDEFQDTNPLQKELVALLAGPGQRLFIVGDPKQSIYLFRGADVTVFVQAQQEVAANGGQNLFFQESFRSRQGLITFVNRFFGRVMEGGDAPFEVNFRSEDRLDPKRRDWDGVPCVELLTAGAPGPAAAQRSLEASAIAARITRLVSGQDEVQVYEQGKGQKAKGSGDEHLAPRTSHLAPDFVPRRPRYGDIAVLLRRFTHLKVFETELRRLGIPYYVVKGRGFYRCQEVLDLLNFLTWLDSAGDLVALAGVLRSPLCGVSDETLFLLAKLEGGIGSWEKLFSRPPIPDSRSRILERIDPADRERLSSLASLADRLRPLRDRLTLAELLEEILTGTDFASILLTTFQGAQKVANLRKLIEVSRSFTAVEGGSLRRFVNYLTELVEAEPTEAEAVVAAEGEDVVRLMTIHQSKGLEFPVVFVPELGAAATITNTQVAVDDTLGLGVKVAVAGAASRPTLSWREIASLRRRKEDAEAKRLLYVAMTRARDYLVLSGEGKGPWRLWLDDFLAEEGDSLVRSSDSSTIVPHPAALAPAGAGDTGSGETPGPGILAAAAGRVLHYTPPLPLEMVFSPTTLEDYRSCPRKYFYKGVLGLDEGLFTELLGTRPAGKGKGRGKGMSAIARGDLAHHLLERLDFAAPADAQRAFCERLAPVLVDDPLDPGVAEVIETVMTFVASPLARAFGAARLFREHPFILRLAGKGRYYLRGAMDLVVLGDRRATVYDYKYLRREDADLEGYRFQLRTYILALSRAFPEMAVAGCLLFLRGGGTEPVTCDTARFENELVEIMDAIREKENEVEFPLKTGCDAGHCPFRQRCMEGR